MDLKEIIIQTVNEVFPTFALNPQFQTQKEEPYLTSTEQVNILMGFSNHIKGTLVLALNKSLALHIASAMMKKELTAFDDVSKSSLAEILNMIVGNTFGKVNPEIITCLSPPTLVTGNNIFLIISRLKSEKLLFQLNEGIFSIAYCIEE